MKKVLLACLVLVAFVNITSVKAAELPKLDHADLEISPTRIGVNGTFSIQTSAQVDGTC